MHAMKNQSSKNSPVRKYDFLDDLFHIIHKYFLHSFTHLFVIIRSSAGRQQMAYAENSAPASVRAGAFKY